MNYVYLFFSILDTKLFHGDSAGNLVIFDVVSGQSTQLLSANFYVCINCSF